MAVMIHACCGPCLLYPASELLRQKTDFTVYFYNPNIHPYQEFRKRLNSFLDLCSSQNYNYLHDPDYGINDFLRSIIFREKSRCRLCYYMRLKSTAALAAEKNYDAFTTTLLYSKYQNHNLIKSLSEELAGLFSIPFLYFDFREGWDDGIERSIHLGLYRQKYCGCLFSEQERFDNRLKKRLKKEKQIDV